MHKKREGERADDRLDEGNVAERRTLALVLAINVGQVVLAGAVGIIAESTGLLGAALDNLGDTAVYVVSLHAVGRGVGAKSKAARLSGVLLIGLALALLGEVIRRFVVGSEPIGWAMIATAIANAASNVIALRLLRSQRDRGVHMEASWIFTTNDMIANGGIVASGITVMVFKSSLPDLLIGIVVAGIVLQGGWEILKQARESRRGAERAKEMDHG
ncbi:MAG: cation transporter [Bryobacteraceae bacterium]|nr:cation transporter [Bryobacteraceae bacterium]